MLAAITTAPHVIELVERPEPAAPPPGQLVVRPEAVGICGSDFHIYTGDSGPLSGAAHAYPRVQGHEISAQIVAAGDGCPAELTAGIRVAVWPLVACGRCYPCRVARPNCCVAFRLIGVHTDGGFQELLTIPCGQAFPASDAAPAVVAFAEPMSVAVHAIRRGRVSAGEQLVILGAGPIGQAVLLAAADLGARVMVVDPVASRREPATSSGAEVTHDGSTGGLAAAVGEWTGGDGAAVVLDTTGDPAALAQALDIVASAGRVVVVGLSGGDAPVRSGILPVKEIDVLGSSCCDADDFAAAVALVQRAAPAVTRLVTDEFPLNALPEAITRAMSRPHEVMKVVVSAQDQGR